MSYLVTFARSGQCAVWQWLVLAKEARPRSSSGGLAKTDEPTNHEAVKRRVSPDPENGDEVQTPALDPLAQRVKDECDIELALIRAGSDPVEVLVGYFDALSW